MKQVNITGVNRRALLLAVIGAVLAAVLLCMPIMTGSATLFAKKVGNAAAGDERYTEAKQEAEAQLAEFEASGTYSGLYLTEDAIERTNSKGETSSTYTFSVMCGVSATGLSMLSCGLPSGRLLLLALILCIAAVVLLLCGSAGSMQAEWSRLTGRPALLRSIGGALALVALLLIPVFMAATVSVIQRQVLTAIKAGDVSGIGSLLTALDRLLFNGTAGDTIANRLSGLKYSYTPWLLLTMAALMIELCGAVLLRRGSLTATFVKGLKYAFVIVLCVVILYPYYVMLITAFRSYTETTDMNFTHIWPTQWVWSNLSDIIARGVPQWLLNSLLLAVGATGIALLCGIPAAYAMARMKFKGKKVFLGFVIMSQMFSPVVLLVGISQLMNTLNMNDSLLGLIFVNAAFNQAFAIWLLRGTFLSISAEMEQAAQIDGCSIMGALIRILLPMAAPGIVTTLIFVFINAWNEYTISTVLISTAAKKPITVGITQFSSFNMIEWQYLFAAALLATIPVVILFMCIEKHLAAGLTAGGVKG